MPLALGRAAFMEELERRIETATDRLCEEAAQVPQRSPHPLAPLAPSSVETLRADLPLPLGQGRGKRRGARHRGRSRRDLTSERNMNTMPGDRGACRRISAELRFFSQA